MGDLSGQYIKGTGSYSVQEITTAVPGLLDVGDTYLECTSSGTIAFPSDQAYGEWEFDFFKDGGGDSASIYLISNEIGIFTSASIRGYLSYFGGAEQFNIDRVNGSSSLTTVITSGSGAGLINTWYRYKITRTLDGEFTLYVKGGTYGNTWTLVSTAGTDATYTESKYFVIDLDAANKIANIITRKAVQQ